MTGDTRSLMITFDTATTKWLAELRAAGASQGSIDLRAYHLNRWAAAHGDPLTATRDDLIQFLAAITGAPEYRRSWRSSLRSFYRTACELAIIDADPAALLPKVRVPIAEARPAPDAAIRTALARADQRQRLMLMLGAVSGLRRAEIARVHTRDLEDGDLLRVHGKGGRVRVVPLDRPLAEAIRRAPAGWLFPGLPGRTSTGHLTPPHVGVLLRRILPEGVTPHMLRHAAATALHDGGLDVFELRGFLGHASVATTQRYVYVRPTRTIAAAREAARRFDAA